MGKSNIIILKKINIILILIILPLIILFSFLSQFITRQLSVHIIISIGFSFWMVILLCINSLNKKGFQKNWNDLKYISVSNLGKPILNSNVRLFGIFICSIIFIYLSFSFYNILDFIIIQVSLLLLTFMIFFYVFELLQSKKNEKFIFKLFPIEIIECYIKLKKDLKKKRTFQNITFYNSKGEHINKFNRTIEFIIFKLKRNKIIIFNYKPLFIFGKRNSIIVIKINDSNVKRKSYQIRKYIDSILENSAISFNTGLNSLKWSAPPGVDKPNND